MISLLEITVVYSCEIFANLINHFLYPSKITIKMPALKLDLSRIIDLENNFTTATR